MVFIHSSVIIMNACVMDDSSSSVIISNEKTNEPYNPLFEKYKSMSTIRRAIRSAIKFNRKLNKQRREERNSYFDTQTLTIQYPQNRKHLIMSSNNISEYPVATLPWQFQDKIQKYSSDFLNIFPLNNPIKSIANEEDIFDNHYIKKLKIYHERNDTDLSKKENSGLKVEDIEEDRNTKLLNDETDTISIDSLPKSTTNDWCSICGFNNNDIHNHHHNNIFIACTECFKTGHPACFGLTPQMTEIIKTYPWQCLNCKTCVRCLNSGGESEIMCCDKCDRGYHSYCVGLNSIPQNQWECPECIKI